MYKQKIIYNYLRNYLCNYCCKYSVCIHINDIKRITDNYVVQFHLNACCESESVWCCYLTRSMKVTFSGYALTRDVMSTLLLYFCKYDCLDRVFHRRVVPTDATECIQIDRVRCEVVRYHVHTRN